MHIPVLTIAFLTVIITVSCSSRPSYVLSKEDMAQLLADIHVGESVVETSSRALSTDSARQAFLQAIYDRHGVTREQVDSSYSWYGYHMDKYMEVYDRTVEILEHRLEKARDLAGASAEGATETQIDLQGDSVDVWPGIRWRKFSPNMPNSVLTFSVPSDRNWENGDVYTLRGKVMGGNHPLIVTIASEYADGRQDYRSATLPGEGWQELTFVLDSARNAVRVWGTISYETSPGETAYLDSISLYRTRWGGHYRDARNNTLRFHNRTSANPVKSSPSSEQDGQGEDRMRPDRLQNTRLDASTKPIDLKEIKTDVPPRTPRPRLVNKTK